MPDPAPPSPIEIVIYRYTGRHWGGLLDISDGACLECGWYREAAYDARQRWGVDRVGVRIVSWFDHLPAALLAGVYHPPGLIVAGRLICQGDGKPDLEAMEAAIVVSVSTP